MSKFDSTEKKVSPYLLQRCRTYEEYLHDCEKAKRATEQAAKERTVVFDSAQVAAKPQREA